MTIEHAAYAIPTLGSERSLRPWDAPDRDDHDDAEAAVVTVGWLGLITNWDNAAADLFGYPHSEAVGLAFGKLILAPAGQRDALRASFARYWKAAGTRIFAHRVVLSALHRDGHEILIALKISSPSSGAGFQAVIRDVSTLGPTVPGRRSEPRGSMTAG